MKLPLAPSPTGSLHIGNALGEAAGPVRQNDRPEPHRGAAARLPRRCHGETLLCDDRTATCQRAGLVDGSLWRIDAAV